MRSFKLITILTLLVVMISACGETEAPGESPELTIHTTVYPLEYIVDEIGQGAVDVSSVFPPGVDGHSYEPSMQEMTGYADGDAFFYVGGVMEAFSDSIATALSGEDVHLVGLSEHETLFQREPHDETVDVEPGNLLIEGAEDHYHTGDTIELMASYDDGPNHFHWYTKASEDEEWSEVTGQYQDKVEIEATHDVGQVKVAQFDDNHEVVAESEPVDIVVDDHDEGHVEETPPDNGEDLEIEGLAGHYHTGDLVELTVSADESYDEFQWYTMSNDSDEWEESGQSGERFEGEAHDTLQMVKVELLDEAGNIISESGSIEILIDDHDELDPHIWVDPIKMIEVGELVLEEMIALSPENEVSYRENYEALKVSLEELDQEFDDTLNDGSESTSSCPMQRSATGISMVLNRYRLQVIR